MVAPCRSCPAWIEDSFLERKGHICLSGSEGGPERSITGNSELSTNVGSVNVYAELDGYVPHWEEYQEAYDRTRKTVRAAVFGGLAGGIFFFGLAAAILSVPVFLVALAIGRLIGSLSSSKVQAM